MLVKAREGFGSRHIYRANDREELDFHLARTPVPSFVQAHCRGEEFSIDVFCDFDGRCLNAIPRTMIESKGGESIKGMTIKDWELIEHGRRVAEALPIWGPGQHPVLPRAGRVARSSPTSTRASAEPSRSRSPRAAAIPELALALANGERPEPTVGEFREGVVHDPLLLRPLL